MTRNRIPIANPPKILNLILPDGNPYPLLTVDRRIHRTSEMEQILPSLPGIYFYLNDNGVVEYVGAASQLNVRPLLVHRNIEPDYWEQTIGVLAFSEQYRQSVDPAKQILGWKYIVKEEILHLEHWCIKYFQPKFNKGYYFNLAKKWQEQFFEHRLCRKEERSTGKTFSFICWDYTR